MAPERTKFDPKKCVVFFDFDNTIATCDVFDNMLLLFSKDDRWVELEKRWKSGRIGSKTCLEGQLRGMDLNKKSLDAYLPKIKLDPYFKPIYKFLLARKVKTLVLSDNYDYRSDIQFRYREKNQRGKSRRALKHKIGRKDPGCTKGGP